MPWAAAGREELHLRAAFPRLWPPTSYKLLCACWYFRGMLALPTVPELVALAMGPGGGCLGASTSQNDGNSVLVDASHRAT